MFWCNVVNIYCEHTHMHLYIRTHIHTHTDAQWSGNEKDTNAKKKNTAQPGTKS